jgi:uncharacterized protein (TIGR03437 family)
MGLITKNAIFAALVLQGSLLMAAPKLRLDNTVVGPITVATGANAPVQTLQAYNAGDGSLNLQFTSSVSWLTASAGTPRPCSFSGSCIPININLATSSLTAGTYTATLVVRDPNALDAPQSVTVTVQVGSNVPDRIDLYAPPGGSGSLRFTAGSGLRSTVTTQDGRQWLTLAQDGGGTFQFTTPYRVTARNVEGQGEGTYQGQIVTAGSSLAADNKTIPVTFRVTTSPIATTAAQELAFRAAQGGPRQTQTIGVTNSGQGSIAISGVTATTASGGDWLTASPLASAPGFITVGINPATTAPGLYRGTVTVNTNAANSALTIPVSLEVSSAGVPYVFFQGARNNATFRAEDPLAPNGIVALFGEQLSSSDPGSASSLPLPTELTGVRVLVNGTAAPIFYTSQNQVNFIIPPGTQPGEANIRVERGGQLGNTITAQIVQAAPRILQFGANQGIIVFPDTTIPGVTGRAARAGDVLVIYALGLGPTTPSVASGAASPGDPLARTNLNYTVSFGGGGFAGNVIAVPFFTGLTPGLVGLYQLNVVVPEGTPRGPAVPVAIGTEAGLTSNVVTLAIE